MTILLTSNVDIKNLRQVLHDTMEGREPDDIGGKGAKFPAGPFMGGSGPLVTMGGGGPPIKPFNGGRGVVWWGPLFIMGGSGPEVVCMGGGAGGCGPDMPPPADVQGRS